MSSGAIMPLLTSKESWRTVEADGDRGELHRALLHSAGKARHDRQMLVQLAVSDSPWMMALSNDVGALLFLMDGPAWLASLLGGLQNQAYLVACPSAAGTVLWPFGPLANCLAAPVPIPSALRLTSPPSGLSNVVLTLIKLSVCPFRCQCPSVPVLFALHLLVIYFRYAPAELLIGHLDQGTRAAA